jgi:hypothetical protein
MKYADEDVYLHIDYSNMPGYWDAFVDSSGEKKKTLWQYPSQEFAAERSREAVLLVRQCSFGRKTG